MHEEERAANSEPESPVQTVRTEVVDLIATPSNEYESRIARVWYRLPEWLRDVIWPAVTPATPAQRDEEARLDAERLNNDLIAIEALATAPDDVLRDAFEGVRGSVEVENERRSSVEARLTTVLGMVSVAASVAFGALTAVFGKGFQGVATPAAVIGAALMVYGTIQLVNALFAALRGLARAGFLVTQPSALLPSPSDTVNEHLRRQIALMVRARAQHVGVNLRKVEAMAVAHTALRHFVVSVLLLSIVVAGVMVVPASDSSQRELIAKLRADPELIDLLRGPSGSVGPQGPPGERGVPGERGRQGPPGDLSPKRKGP